MGRKAAPKPETLTVAEVCAMFAVVLDRIRQSTPPETFAAIAIDVQERLLGKPPRRTKRDAAIRKRIRAAQRDADRHAEGAKRAWHAAQNAKTPAARKLALAREQAHRAAFRSALNALNA